MIQKAAQRQPRETTRLYLPKSCSVTADEQTAWQELLASTGLRAHDLMRRAIRLMVMVDEAQQRGDTMVIRGSDGSETRLIVV